MDFSLRAAGQEVLSEWPYFLYLMLTIVFSVCFLRERRREMKYLAAAVDRLQRSVDSLRDEPWTKELVTSSGRPERPLRRMHSKQFLP